MKDDKIVNRAPMIELWDSNGTVEAKREWSLSLDERNESLNADRKKSFTFRLPCIARLLVKLSFDESIEMYKPEKLVWSESDFEIMGWHDCPIYGILFADKVTLDIDYIFKWVLNEQNGHYEFWISPATLVFEQARNLKIEIDSDFINGLEIADIHQQKLENKEYKYHIETQEVDILLIASGYRQYIRKKPVLKKSQSLTDKERDGYSFITI